MFLGVSGSVRNMDLPDEKQREDLAGRLKAVRLGRFKGNRSGAYSAARVNAETWKRAENGMTLKERSLVAIVSAFWPESGGDWTKLDPPLGTAETERPIDDYIAELEAAQGISDEAKRAIIDRLHKPA